MKLSMKEHVKGNEVVSIKDVSIDITSEEIRELSGMEGNPTAKAILNAAESILKMAISQHK